MPLRHPLKAHLVRTLTMFLLLVLISACGSNTTVQGGGTPPSQRNTSTPGNQNGTSPTANSVRAFDIPGLLHIQAWADSYSFSCSPEYLFDSIPGALVLATNNLTYQSVEIQQIKVYSTAVFNGTQSSGSMPAMPDTLRFVPGSPSTNLSMWNDVSSHCYGGFQITNISNSTIQLSQISMEYMAASQPNNYSYRLLNICSLLTTQDTCPTPRGGGSSGYYYQFQLKPGSANTEIPGQQTDVNGQPISVGPTLDPGKVAFLNFSTVLTGTPDNFVYSVRPKLTFDVVGEQHSIELSQLDRTLAIADTSQFSCYTLQGGTFTQLSTKQNDSVWCV